MKKSVKINIYIVIFLVTIIWTGFLCWKCIGQYKRLDSLEQLCINYIAKDSKKDISFLNQSSIFDDYIMNHIPCMNSIIRERNGNKEGHANKTISVFNNGGFDITKNNHMNSSISNKQIQNAMKTSVIQNDGKGNQQKIQHLLKEKKLSYLLSKYYIVDRSTSIDKSVFNVKQLLGKNVAMKKSSKPQILILHTHGASEYFADSHSKDKAKGIVGVGDYLTNILTKKYHYNVIHDRTCYDLINGKIDRNKAYNKSYEGAAAILKEHPSVEVVIDLHRDGVGNKVHRLTEIKGKRTAQVMFFNGLSRNQNGNIAYLKNNNLQGNLAFSLKMKLGCMKLYGDFAKPIYLKNYRYNMHLREKYLLIELGNENNTLEEAKNAMPPLAHVLDFVLSGKDLQS